jgi:hypothetical protein
MRRKYLNDLTLFLHLCDSGEVVEMYISLQTDGQPEKLT